MECSINRKLVVKNCKVYSLEKALKEHNINIPYDILYVLSFSYFTMFSMMKINGFIYPFISSFKENCEEDALKALKINYVKKHISFKSEAKIEQFVKKYGPFISLYNSEIIKNNSPASFSVCAISSVVIFGVDQGNYLSYIFDYREREEKFNISQFEKSRKKITFPSSPKKTMYIVKKTKKGYVDNYSDILNFQLFNLISNEVNRSKKTRRTNTGKRYFISTFAREKIIDYFKELVKLCNNTDIEERKVRKYISLNLKIFKKTLTSGSYSFNRLELAYALFSIYNKSEQKNKLILDLYNLFSHTGKEFIEIVDIIKEILDGETDYSNYKKQVERLFMKIKHVLEKEADELLLIHKKYRIYKLVLK